MQDLYRKEEKGWHSRNKGVRTKCGTMSHPAKCVCQKACSITLVSGINFRRVQQMDFSTWETGYLNITALPAPSVSEGYASTRILNCSQMLNEERSSQGSCCFLPKQQLVIQMRGFLLLSTFSHKQYFTGKKNNAQTTKRQTAVFTSDTIKSPENMPRHLLGCNHKS